MTLDRRLDRIGRRAAPPASGVAVPRPLDAAGDVLAIVEEAIREAWRDGAADPLDRARTLGYLAGVAIKALEARDLTARVEALERVLKLRRTAG